MATYLRRRDPATREQLQNAAERPGATPQETILAVFDVLAAWADSGHYRGCAFLNAVSECPNDAAVRAAAIAHKDAVEAWFRAQLGPVPDAALCASMLMVLYDGALVRALVYHSGAPVREAGAAAARVLKRAAPLEQT